MFSRSNTPYDTMSIHAFRMFLLYILQVPNQWAHQNRFLASIQHGVALHPIFRSNMKKLSFQHTCEQGTVLIGPHLQTWQRFLRWLGNIGNIWNGFICNTQWTDIQIKFHGSQKRTSAIPSPHSKRKAATLFFCRVAISLGDPSTRLVDVIVEAAPRFFDSREVPMLENAQSCWPHLNHWPFRHQDYCKCLFVKT